MKKLLYLPAVFLLVMAALSFIGSMIFAYPYGDSPDYGRAALYLIFTFSEAFLGTALLAFASKN